MIKLDFEKLSRFERIAEPATVAIPFPQGTMKDFNKLRVFDDGRVLPTQVKQTAAWQDGSCKWAVLDFEVDLPGNKGKSVTVDLGDATVETNLKVEKITNGVKIATGAMQAEFGNSGFPLFGEVIGEGFSFASGELTPPWIVVDGKKYQAVVDSNGWNIECSGDVKAQIVAKGKHRAADGAECLDFSITITAFAGKPWLQVDYRWINCEAVPQIKLDSSGVAFRATAAVTDAKTLVATSNYLTDYVYGEGSETVSKLIDADYLLYDMNEHFAETFYGNFFTDWCSPSRGGVCFTHYQAYQNFPKQLTADSSGFSAGILPEQSSGLQLIQGVAKTHTFFYHFHAVDEPLEQINARSSQFQMPDCPMLQPEVYHQAAVLEDVFSERRVERIERLFINMADFRIRAYGILNWGDAPDTGYTMQGRGNGDLVWSNNEYDFGHAMMLMFARTCYRRMFDFLKVNVEHQIDVDICHYSPDPLRMGGQIIHSANHVSGDARPCHQWVEGLLDYYHLTGKPEALEAAFGIGENLLRILQQPRYQGEGGINARETGWAMRVFVALYRETYDEKWLKPCEKIVSHFKLWKKEFGGWFSPYTDHTAIRVPFMISIAISSLMRYYRVRPDDSIKQMILEAVDDMMKNSILENGLFYYKELPSLQRLNSNPLVLEALTYAYEFTDNVKYLKAGLPTFEINLQTPSRGNKKEHIKDAVICRGGSDNKRMAQSFHTMAYYYRAIVAEKLI